jgi:hypothetical protein
MAGGCEAAVLVDAVLVPAAVGQQRLVVGQGAAELDAVAGRDGSLNLEVDLEAPGLGGRDERVHLRALGARQIGGLGRLVALAPVELPIGREAGRRDAAQFAPAPEVAVEQADTARPGIDRRFAPCRRIVARRHDIGRGGDRSRTGHLEVVEHPLDAFGLDPLGHHRDAEEPAHDESSSSQLSSIFTSQRCCSGGCTAFAQSDSRRLAAVLRDMRSAMASGSQSSSTRSVRAFLTTR